MVCRYATPPVEGHLQTETGITGKGFSRRQIFQSPTAPAPMHEMYLELALRFDRSKWISVSWKIPQRVSLPNVVQIE
jgi:hypothetical protein